jgi:hypothetical protein
MDYSERLLQAMTYSQKSRKALSEAIGQSVQSIGMVINRRNGQLSTRANARAAAFMGVDPNWLATGEGSMTVAQEPSEGAPAHLSHDASHLGMWLDKITDPEKRYRAAHAAMAVILKVLDGPPTPPTPEPVPETGKRHAERSRN